MDAGHEDDNHPARRWLRETFGTVDPFASLEHEQREHSRWPRTGRDGRTVVEEKVFIILQVLLEDHLPLTADLHHVARTTVTVVHTSTAETATAAVARLLELWNLPPERLAHATHIITRVAAEG